MQLKGLFNNLMRAMYIDLQKTTSESISDGLIHSHFMQCRIDLHILVIVERTLHYWILSTLI